MFLHVFEFLICSSNNASLHEYISVKGMLSWQQPLPLMLFVLSESCIILSLF